MKIRFNFARAAALLLAGGFVAGPAAAAPDEAAAKARNGDYTGFACLNSTLPCYKIPVRKIEKKELVGPLNGDVNRGREVAMTRAIGNCLACHVLKEGEQPGNRGLPLDKYGTWERTDAETYTLVWDMRLRNPDTVMPLMGTNGVLTEQQIRDVVAYLQSSK